MNALSRKFVSALTVLTGSLATTLVHGDEIHDQYYACVGVINDALPGKLATIESNRIRVEMVLGLQRHNASTLSQFSQCPGRKMISPLKTRE